VVARGRQNQWVATAMGPGALGQDSERGGMSMPARQRNKVLVRERGGYFLSFLQWWALELSLAGEWFCCSRFL